VVDDSEAMVATLPVRLWMDAVVAARLEIVDVVEDSVSTTALVDERDDTVPVVAESAPTPRFDTDAVDADNVLMDAEKMFAVVDKRLETLPVVVMRLFTTPKDAVMLVAPRVPMDEVVALSDPTDPVERFIVPALRLAMEAVVAPRL
jgi:hypothetical protein